MLFTSSMALECGAEPSVFTPTCENDLSLLLKKSNMIKMYLIRLIFFMFQNVKNVILKIQYSMNAGQSLVLGRIKRKTLNDSFFDRFSNGFFATVYMQLMVDIFKMGISGVKCNM